jgi:hypothetical protein
MNYQDPAIKEMAEQIANDPAFQEVTKSLQQSFGSMMGPGGPGMPGGMPGMPGMPGGMPGMPGGMPGMPGMPGGPDVDPSVYMNAMSSMFQNQVQIRFEVLRFLL